MTSASTFPPKAQTTPPQGSNDGLLIRAAEAGWIPDRALRWGIRRICAERLREEQRGGAAAIRRRTRDWLEQWQDGPIAVLPEAANAQHYEVPAEFFDLALGPQLKYSCALWPEGVDTLADAETAMLALTCERAGLEDGMQILELGCGWGSLSLWMAQRYPNARIVAVSNSTDQYRWITTRARERGLDNLLVVTADINRFQTGARFDRVVSVEMFEHCRNHARLFQHIRQWLKPGGKLFTHVFCHRALAYPYESRGDSDWMARHFFSGGIMPSYDLFIDAQHSLALEQRWWLDGQHYQRTSEAWLQRLDARSAEAIALFEAQGTDGRRAVQRWRMFFMAVAELFGYEQGRQWGVGHYLFAAPDEATSAG